MTSYAILGGGGAFGIQTALYLLEQPETESVLGIGRAPLRPEAFTFGIEKHAKYRYEACHIGQEFARLCYLLDPMPDVIINFAAQGEGAVSFEQSWRFFDTNCTALVRLCEWLSHIGCHFIHISSSEVYGSRAFPVDEEFRLVTTTPYAASKAGFDLYLQAMNERKEFGATIIRPSNCYCPGQLLHRVIPRAVVCGLTGQKLPLHGGGHAEKSYLHARDLARAIHLLRGSYGEPPVVNVGPQGPIAIRDIVAKIADQLGLAFDDLAENAEERPQDARYWLDSSLMHSLGWKQTISLDEGILGMIAWGRQYIDTLRDWPQTYTLRP